MTQLLTVLLCLRMCVYGGAILSTTSWSIPTRTSSENQQNPHITVAVQHQQEHRSVQHNNIPKGKLVCACTKSVFLHIGHDFSSGRGYFIAFSRGTSRDPHLRHGASVGPGLRGTHSGRSLCRNLVYNRGEAFGIAEAKQDKGTPQFHDFKRLLCCY